MNQVLKSNDFGIVSWQNNNFSVILSEFAKEQGIVDVVEDSVDNKLFCLMEKVIYMNTLVTKKQLTEY